MKILLLLFSVLIFSTASLSQVDCAGADYICNENGFSFQTSITSGGINDLCIGCLSNPFTNMGSAGNEGCLLNGEVNPVWIIINVAQAGVLEFTLGSAGGEGYYDWALWPYNASLANPCAPINNNQVAPVACNWNGSGSGYTGMVAPGTIPPGGSFLNFEHAISVAAGSQFVLMFSNWSGTNGVNVPVSFGNSIPGNNNANTALVSCTPSTPDQTICAGSAVSVEILSTGFVNPTYLWLTTAGVANINSPTNVLSPAVTTTYIVQITEGSVTALDTFVVNVIPAPTPYAGVDQVVCNGTPANLSSSNTQQGSTINWTQTNTSSGNVVFTPNSSNPNPTLTMSQPGTYTFTLTEDNGVCAPVSDQVVVLVSNTTHTTSFTAPSCPGANNGSITVLNNNAVEYSIDNGVTWSVNNIFSGLDLGTYNVHSVNANGCSYSSVVNIVGSTPVVLTVNADTMICQNGTATLTASINMDVSSMLFRWSHNNLTSATNTISPEETTTVTVYAEGMNGCVSNTESIVISILPTLTADFSASPLVCPGYPGELVVSNIAGGSGQGYNVLFYGAGTLSNSTGLTQIVIPYQTSIYTAIIHDNCESTPITLIDSILVGQFPELLIDIPTPILCEPAVFEIFNATDLTNVVSYGFYTSDGSNSTGQSPLITNPLPFGVYNVHLWIQTLDGCIDSTRFIGVFESVEKPVARFNWSPNPVTNFNTNVLFTDLSTDASSYEWFMPGGSPIFSTERNPRTTYPDGEVADYETTLVVTSDLGCTDTLTKVVPVIQEVLLYVPNTFTPDGDEYNQIWKAYITGVDVSRTTLYVFNRWGEMIFENHDLEKGWNGTYNGKPVPDGTYIWKIKAKEHATDKLYEWHGEVNVIR